MRWFSLAPRKAAQWRVSRVYWLSILGIVIWTGIVATGQVPGTPPIALEPFLLVLVLAAVNLGFRSIERLRRPENSNPRLQSVLGWVFVLVDLVLVAAGLRLTGGIESPLWLVLFLIGVAETILTTSVEAQVILGFGVAALLFGTFPLPPEPVTSGYFLELALRSGLFYAVSSVTRRLRENSDADKREVATLRAELTLAEERARLSREIHDGVGNSLAAAVMHLEVAARGLEKRQPGDSVAALLREEAATLREAMTSVRDWTFFTRPWASGAEESDRPPSVLIASEVDRLSRRTGLPMELEGVSALDDLPPATRLTALRIVQEALTNAAKHAAGATQVRVSFYREGPSVTLAIADNGSGFEVASASAGIGLSSMRERAEGIGGAFAIASAPGQGTRVLVTLPAG